MDSPSTRPLKKQIPSSSSHEGVVASVVETLWAAKMARVVNNASVLSMGGMAMEPSQAI